MNPELKISDYDYELPDERIAKFPLARRDQSKLLVCRQGTVSEDCFSHLADYLPEGALMVCNNTRVIQARLHFRKPTADGSRSGALIEVFLLEPFQPADYEQMFQTKGCCSWLCLVGNQKKWKDGTLSQSLEIGGQSCELRATRRGQHGTSQLIDFEWSNPSTLVTFADVIDAAGELPIPPYLNRATQESDKTTYQTVYSRIKGSVAAPTAGLHFTSDVLATIASRGIDREEVTLHVGAGTFRPVKSEFISGHEMHSEHISVNRQTIEKLLAHECRAIAVGTTSVRTLESLYFIGCKILRQPDISEEQLHVSQWEPYDETVAATGEVAVEQALSALLQWLDRNGLDTLHTSTQIIIVPGYRYRIVTHLVTNFHQPQSTLLLLVSAFIGDCWRNVYDYALAHDFRFLSYGDSSLLIP